MKRPGMLQALASMGLQRGRHDRATELTEGKARESTFLTSFQVRILDWVAISFSNLLSPVQLFSCVRLFATPWTASCQTSLSITNSWSLLKLMSIELVMLSNHFVLCRPLLLLPSIFPSIKVFSNESVLCIKWPKY